MKNLCAVLFLLVTLLSGCSSKPTAYIYAKYLTQQQQQEIKQAFENSGIFNTELNEFDIPVDVTENTILYSLLLRQPELIYQASAISESAGYKIEHTQGLTHGNHWYTKNALAVFLVPASTVAGSRLFRQDLVHQYESQDCKRASSLQLKKTGKFTLTFSNAADMENRAITGTWSYREYPFIELQRDGIAYAEFYFEIEQFNDSDKISEIEFIRLTSLNPGVLSEGCSFIIGTRI